ncbi:MFS transporter [Coprinopsis cinerea AmutBmut pab1-1]|nr:MFS transporter [Coprinopsis cinerea AmutBmut pab1-1]
MGSTTATATPTPRTSLDAGSTVQGTHSPMASDSNKEATTVCKENLSPSESEKSRSPKTRRQSAMGIIQLLSLSGCLFNLGWNDGTPGPMLPRLQEVYHASATIF